mmetsp:Transcript_54422/g.167534  ORF Transcript_54422/g.167534 Transcript_54422/m.167534 type:complete len:234 (-) Transcript_54422:861-1562(-)
MRAPRQHRVLGTAGAAGRHSRPGLAEGLQRRGRRGNPAHARVAPRRHRKLHPAARPHRGRRGPARRRRDERRRRPPVLPAQAHREPRRGHRAAPHCAPPEAVPWPCPRRRCVSPDVYGLGRLRRLRSDLVAGPRVHDAVLYRGRARRVPRARRVDRAAHLHHARRVRNRRHVRRPCVPVRRRLGVRLVAPRPRMRLAPAARDRRRAPARARWGRDHRRRQRVGALRQHPPRRR